MTKKKLVAHVPKCGGWSVIELEGKVIYSGHSRITDLDWALFEELDIELEEIEYSDEEYEEKFS